MIRVLQRLMNIVEGKMAALIHVVNYILGESASLCKTIDNARRVDNLAILVFL